MQGVREEGGGGGGKGEREIQRKHLERVELKTAEFAREARNRARIRLCGIVVPSRLQMSGRGRRVS